MEPEYGYLCGAPKLSDSMASQTTRRVPLVFQMINWVINRIAMMYFEPIKFQYNYAIRPFDWVVKWVVIHFLEDGCWLLTIYCDFVLSLLTLLLFPGMSMREAAEKQFRLQHKDQEVSANTSKLQVKNIYIYSIYVDY